MHNFTPLSALAGGLLIGLATVLYFITTGRYAGISGVLRAAAFGEVGRSLDILFAIGLVVGGVLVFRSGTQGPAPLGAQPLWAVGTGGVLVGVGTALGRGCTSGHGVCGLGRLSRRSLVAVLTFLATGVATVYVRHRFGVIS